MGVIILLESEKIGPLAKANEIWQSMRDPTQAATQYFSPFADSVKAGKLARELGGISAVAYVRTYGGVPYIILKGHPGLRRKLTGTRYGLMHTKVIQMGLGTAGVKQAVKGGGVISIFLASGFRIIDYFLTDEATLTSLFGGLAVDIAKVGVVTGVALAAVVMFGGVTLAVGPLVAVIVFSVATSSILDALDSRYKITNHVIQALDELCEKLDPYWQKGKAVIQAIPSHVANAVDATKTTINTTTDSVINYFVETGEKLSSIVLRPFANEPDTFA